MKALAIDTSTSKFFVAAKNGERSVSSVYDIGMKQSETLLPAIDYALEKAGIKPNELDYSVITAGPGSFTGLRLSFAACKALTLANSTPLYTVPTLEALAWRYRELPFFVVPLIDAKKNRFYAAAYCQSETILEPGDYEIGKILEALKSENITAKHQKQEILTECIKNNTEKLQKSCKTNCQLPIVNSQLLLVGDDAKLFTERVNENSDEKFSATKNNFKFSIINSQVITDALFEIAEKKMAENIPPALDYDAPLYIRASEAEEKLLL